MVGCLSLGLNGCRPPETGGHFQLLQRFLCCGKSEVLHQVCLRPHELLPFKLGFTWFIYFKLEQVVIHMLLFAVHLGGQKFITSSTLLFGHCSYV